MKRTWMQWLMVVAVLAAVPMWSAAQQGEGGKKPRADRKFKKDKPKSKRPAGYWGIMAAAADLTDEQLAQAQEAAKARNKALQDWNKGERGKRLAALREEIKQLLDERTALELHQAKRYEERLATILDATQLTKWYAVELKRSIGRRLHKLDLDEQQAQRVDVLCQQVAAEVVAGKDKTELAEVLMQRIANEVLNDAQRNKLPNSAPVKKAQPKPKTDAPAAGSVS